MICWESLIWLLFQVSALKSKKPAAWRILSARDPWYLKTFIRQNSRWIPDSLFAKCSLRSQAHMASGKRMHWIHWEKALIHFVAYCKHFPSLCFRSVIQKYVECSEKETKAQFYFTSWSHLMRAAKSLAHARTPLLCRGPKL